MPPSGGIFLCASRHALTTTFSEQYDVYATLNGSSRGYQQAEERAHDGEHCNR